MDITHAGVTVVDLEHSVWFYRDLLGMEVVRQYTSMSDVARLMWNAPGLDKLESAMMRLPGSQQQVQLTQAFGDFGARRDRLAVDPWDVGAARLSLPVADLEATVSTLAANGFPTLGGGIARSAECGRRGAVVVDPSGLFVELWQTDVEPTHDAFHAGITVEDLERSIGFYRDELGMEVLHRETGDVDLRRSMWGAPGLQSIESALLRMPGFSLQLELAATTGLAARRLVGHQWDVGFAHACYTLGDLDDVFRRLATSADIRPKAVVRNMIDAWVTGSHVPDPDGFDLELLQLS